MNASMATSSSIMINSVTDHNMVYAVAKKKSVVNRCFIVIAVILSGKC